MQEFENLLAANDIEAALSLLKAATQENERERQNVTLAMSRWVDIKQQVSRSLIEVGDSTYNKNVAHLKYSLLEIAKQVRTWPVSVIPAPVKSAAPTNKVAAIRGVFRKIKEDIENLAYSKDAVSGYVRELNAAMESNSFDPFLDSLNGSEWNGFNSAERNETVRKVLENLARNEEKIVSRITEYQNKLNGTVSLDESIVSFFSRPTLKTWNELSAQLSNRFADSSLFGADVSVAFENWKQKINVLEDELMFAMDFNLDFRKDFGAFLSANLQVKNFNY